MDSRLSAADHDPIEEVSTRPEESKEYLHGDAGVAQLGDPIR